jgi:hypothetical protein
MVSATSYAVIGSCFEGVFLIILLFCGHPMSVLDNSSCLYRGQLPMTDYGDEDKQEECGQVAEQRNYCFDTFHDGQYLAIS